MKQFLIAVLAMVMVAVVVSVAMAEECVPPCDGERFIVRTVQGTDYWCDIQWAWVAMGEARLLRVKADTRQKDYPIVNVISFEAPLGSIPYTKQR